MQIEGIEKIRECSLAYRRPIRALFRHATIDTRPVGRFTILGADGEASQTGEIAIVAVISAELVEPTLNLFEVCARSGIPEEA